MRLQATFSCLTSVPQGVKVKKQTQTFLIRISIKMTELLVCDAVYLNIWSFSLHHGETDPSQTFSEFHPLFMSLIVCHPESLN